jgi:NAD(P)-dependent dehydrogenase (short-subunit alcohol dehydrogenase family)
LARRLAQAGERVVISGRRTEDLAQVAAGQPGILPFPLDIADSSAVRNGVQRIERDIAPISLAVLTAGPASPPPLSSFERERLRGQFDGGVGGALNCLGALVPVLRQRGRGHVAIVPPPSGKAGGSLATLARSLSHDLASSGIKIQVIDPDLLMSSAEDSAADVILRGLCSDAVTVGQPGPPGRRARFLRLLRRLTGRT